jgi:hypothetical protein
MAHFCDKQAFSTPLQALTGRKRSVPLLDKAVFAAHDAQRRAGFGRLRDSSDPQTLR